MSEYLTIERAYARQLCDGLRQIPRRQCRHHHGIVTRLFVKTDQMVRPYAVHTAECRPAVVATVAGRTSGRAISGKDIAPQVYAMSVKHCFEIFEKDGNLRMVTGVGPIRYKVSRSYGRQPGDVALSAAIIGYDRPPMLVIDIRDPAGYGIIYDASYKAVQDTVGSLVMFMYYTNYLQMPIDWLKQ